MGQWIKYFADGTSYTGEDSAVARGEASWRLSRDLYIIGAELEHKGFLLRIKGSGEYWQSDSFESAFPVAGGILIKRRIERKLKVTDQYFSIDFLEDKVVADFGKKGLSGLIVTLPVTTAEKWFVLELDTRTRQTCWYIRDEKL